MDFQRLFITTTLLAFGTSLAGVLVIPADAFARTGSTLPGTKRERTIVTFEGKISGLRNERDRTKKRFWQYRLRTTDGRTVLVHDYRLGRYRQPATMGLQEGARRKVRGFFVHISPQRGGSAKTDVLIVSP